MCGRNCTAFDKNEFNYQYQFIENMTEYLVQDRKEIMAEEDEPCDDFPEDIFFILDRYGDEYNYILANGDDELEVYYYNYLDDSHKKVFNSVEDWFEAHATDVKNFRDKGFFPFN